MSQPNQNSILAHRSIYGDSSQSGSSTEYKTITIQKKSLPTPRRIVNKKMPNNVISYYDERSQLILEIANLKDDIARLNSILDEKMKGFTYSELSTIFYLKKSRKPIETTSEKYEELASLDKTIEKLSDIYDYNSINRLNKSNMNQKILLNSVYDDLQNNQIEIQKTQDEINKIKNSDIFTEIFKQRNKISEMHKEIHKSVEIHRKLKRKLKKLQELPPKSIEELEFELSKANERKKDVSKKYQNIRKSQLKERLLAKAEIKRRSQKFSISSPMQSFELIEKFEENDDQIQQSIVSFEKASCLNETEFDVNSEFPKKYVQEIDILANSDFEIAAKFLSESEEENCKSRTFKNPKEKSNVDQKLNNSISKSIKNENNSKSKYIEIDYSKKKKIKNEEKNEKSFGEEEEKKSKNKSKFKEEESKNNEKENVFEEEVKSKNENENKFKEEESKNENENILKEEESKNENENVFEEEEEDKNENENENKFKEEESKKENENKFKEEESKKESENKFKEEESKNENENKFKEEESKKENESMLKEEESKNENKNVFEEEEESKNENENKFKEEESKNENENILKEKEIKNENENMLKEKEESKNEEYDEEESISENNESEKADFVNNSVQCDLNKKENEEANSTSVENAIKEVKRPNCDLRSFLFPPESEIDTTSVVYSESDISVSQLEKLKKEMKAQKMHLRAIENIDQVNTEIDLNENLDEYSSMIDSYFDYRTDSQSESTTIFSSLIYSLSERRDDDSLLNESTSIATSESDFKFTKTHESPLNHQKKMKKKAIRKTIEKTNRNESDFSYNYYSVENDDFISLKSSKPVAIESKDTSDQFQLSSDSSIGSIGNKKYSTFFDKNARKSKIDNKRNSPLSLLGKKVNNSPGHKKAPSLLFSDYSEDELVDESVGSSQSNRRQRKKSDIEDKFVAVDDRKTLKIGLFAVKPSKKEVLPYFVRFGSVSSCVVKQNAEGKYFILMSFDRHEEAKNAKKNLNGSKISGIRLNISLESETNSKINPSKSIKPKNVYLHDFPSDDSNHS